MKPHPEQLNVRVQHVPKNPTFTDQPGGLLNDVNFVVGSDSLGELSFIRKKTPYVCNPADGLLMALQSNASQITDLTPLQQKEFLSIAGFIANEFSSRVSGIPVIAINQQTECREIPSKYSQDGTELKVQTINELHAHIFMLDGSQNHLCTIAELDSSDRNDFYDPIGLGFLKLFIQNYGLSQKYSNLFFETSQQPLGLTLQFDSSISCTLNTLEFAKTLSDLQRDFVSFYCELRDLMNNFLFESYKARYLITQNVLKDFDLTDDEYRLLHKVGSCLRRTSAEEKRKHMRLVQGPALTWIIFEDNGKTKVNLTPRVFSRGNAMEAMGYWVEQTDEIDNEEQGRRREFMDKVHANLLERLKINNSSRK